MERPAKPAYIPEFKGNLRSNIIRVPEAISESSGIVILGKLIKSLLFSTDVAIIRNTNADAIIAVYPFTPQPIITHALILAADKPIFCGIGGGLTTGKRSLEIALDAEFQGALGVVLNKPAPNELIERLKKKLEIPVIVTVVSDNEDFEGRIKAGVDIFNVSGAAQTDAIVRKIRSVDAKIPIIATGGREENHIRKTIEAGANAITHTPPSTGELFRVIMNKYRSGQNYK
jgi:isopentenyl diphosphate isomerase/L-lactate dehydrogenase-like FMN-dependent dehydrogenase